jgi:hypothetical protein
MQSGGKTIAGIPSQKTGLWVLELLHVQQPIGIVPAIWDGPGFVLRSYAVPRPL